jgi:hypothetical protein
VTGCARSLGGGSLAQLVSKPSKSRYKARGVVKLPHRFKLRLAFPETSARLVINASIPEEIRSPPKLGITRPHEIACVNDPLGH